MEDIDITSDRPLESPPAPFSFDALLADAHATMATKQAAVKRRDSAGGAADPQGIRSIEEDRQRYRQTFTKLRYVLMVDLTQCVCGEEWKEPQGIYEESQSSKGGATNLALVVAARDPDLPRVIRYQHHKTSICPTCAASRGFRDE